MSTFDPSDLESPENLTVPINSRTIRFNEDGTKTQFKINTHNNFAKIAAVVKIVNEDPVNPITFRLPSLSAELRTVPPNTSTTIKEYTTFIELNFDILNITSYMELDLVNIRDSRRRSSLVGRGAA